jgi:hypothetical protein
MRFFPKNPRRPVAGVSFGGGASVVEIRVVGPSVTGDGPG